MMESHKNEVPFLYLREDIVQSYKKITNKGKNLAFLYIIL
jgi:hypothetical protein